MSLAQQPFSISLLLLSSKSFILWIENLYGKNNGKQKAKHHKKELSYLFLDDVLMRIATPRFLIPHQNGKDNAFELFILPHSPAKKCGEEAKLKNNIIYISIKMRDISSFCLCVLAKKFFQVKGFFLFSVCVNFPFCLPEWKQCAIVVCSRKKWFMVA